MYDVRWSETAIRELAKLPKAVSRRIIEKVEFISNDPYIFVNKLKGFDLYKLRVGNYRVIMSIERNKMIIFVLEVGHRSTIYHGY
ncbi:MAG: type II toxin-antitoxin system RelE/ParE family toxin [Candidatus Aenigmatarchaeota archaeon]